MPSLFILCLNFQAYFRQRFFGNYLSQLFKIITHYLLRHAIRWLIFLYQSDVNIVFNGDFPFLYIHIRAGRLPLSIVAQISCYNIFRFDVNKLQLAAIHLCRRTAPLLILFRQDGTKI